MLRVLSIDSAISMVL